MSLNNWEECDLKNLIEVESGCAFKSDQFVDSGVIVVKIGNIDNHQTVKTNDDSFISLSEMDRYKNFLLKKDDVLIAMSGNTTCKMGLVTSSFCPSLLNQRVGRIKSISETISIKYIYYLLISDKYQKKLWNFATATGQQNLSPRDILKLPFNKPPLPEQKMIAAILSKVDEAISAVEDSIKAAEKVKKALMQNLLTGKLKPDGTWRSEDNLFITKYGTASKHWKYWQIKDLIREGYILKVQDGNHGELHPTSQDFVEHGIPFVMASDIANGFVDMNKCKKIPENISNNLRIGFAYNRDVLISHKASIGYTCIVEKAEPYFMLTPQVTLYRCNSEKLLPEYLLYFFQQYNFQNILEAFAKQSTRNYIGITNQKKMWIYLPKSIEEQLKIIQPLMNIDSIVKSKKNKIETLKKLKKSLMQNLLTGKIRINPSQFPQEISHFS